MVRANSDIRAEARNAGVTLWAVAREIGVSEATLTRRMRVELRGDEKTQMRGAISRIVQMEARKDADENNS